MLRNLRTEIKPTQEQIAKIRNTVGTCRYVYNLFISENKKRYEAGLEFLSGYDFSKWLNNEFLPANPDKVWIRDVSSKSVKQSIMDAEAAYKRFMKGLSGFPNLKRKGRCRDSMYFVRNNNNDCLCERHRVKIPTLGWARLKEKGYLPYNKAGPVIRSGRITVEAGRYYITVTVDIPDEPKPVLSDTGIGIDMGVKDLMILSDGTKIRNVNKSKRVRALKKRLKREQRRLSRKYEAYKKDKKKLENNTKKGEATLRLYERKNYQKQSLRLQKLHQKLQNIRTDYVNKAVSTVAKAKPPYITIEDLSVSGMMRNRHLAKAVAEQKLYELRAKLTDKCRQYGIEIRMADRWYPSSKTCHACGYVKRDLKLSDRTYVCPVCGYTEDRDLNAAMNLMGLETYEIAS